MEKNVIGQKIKLLVACCSTLSRLGLCEILSKEKDLFIVQKTSSVDDTIYYANETNPDILLICSQLLIESGIELISKIISENTMSKLVVFNSAFRLEQELLLAKEGVAGILSADSTPRTIVKALRKVYAGDVWLRRELISSVVGSHLNPHKTNISGDCDQPLTKRELEVLSHIAAGYKNREISSNLCISESTVKTHINSIYKKLAINDRLQVTLHALKYNLLSR